MNNSNTHTRTTTPLTIALALSCSLFTLRTSAATWVEAGSSTLLSQARQSMLSAGNNRFLPRNSQQGLQRSAHVRKWQYYKGVRVLGAEIIERQVGPISASSDWLGCRGLVLKALTRRAWSRAGLADGAGSLS